MKSYWREHAAPIIARVIAENKGKSAREIRRALRDKYPFGPREYHPYKIWLDEIAKQLGEKKKIFGRRRKKTPPSPDQMKLF